MNANAVLEREFLKARAKILEIAAILDRIDRSEGDVHADRRHKLLRQGVETLLTEGANRAEQIQLVFSLPHDEDWQRKFELT
jgi:hypothetical protein